MTRRPWRLSIGIEINLGPADDQNDRESATDALVERSDGLPPPMGFQPSYVQPEDRR